MFLKDVLLTIISRYKNMNTSYQLIPLHSKEEKGKGKENN